MAAPSSEIALSASDVEAFVSEVRSQGARLYRDLPWRYIDDPYQVLVSEVMLQQTQVSRVLKYWPEFLRRFPTVDALAAASVGAVLETWQGLGYNRRALALKRACEYCSAHHGGKLPESYEELIALDGVGPATAAGVRAFAFHQPGVYLETNVRTVYIHHFFPGEEKVSDKVLGSLVKQTCPEQDVIGWYYALLDYGAHLKSTVGNLNRRSKSYTRQSTFEGSKRQKRAFLVRCVLDEPGIDLKGLQALLDEEELKAKREAVDPAFLQELLDQLCAEGFFSCQDGRYFS